MKVLTIIVMILFVVSCCLIDRHLNLKSKGQEEGIYYWRKKTVKDWDSEETSTAKRLWIEKVNNFKYKK